MWICHFINKFPALHKNSWKSLGKESIPVWFAAAFSPIPGFGILMMCLLTRDFSFRYYKPKVIMKINYLGKVDVGYAPKYLKPENINKFLYEYQILDEYKYKQTSRLTKALSGNFLKQKENKHV